MPCDGDGGDLDADNYANADVVGLRRPAQLPPVVKAKQIPNTFCGDHHQSTVLVVSLNQADKGGSLERYKVDVFKPKATCSRETNWVGSKPA